ADESDEVMGGVFERPFELLLGRRTYDIFAAYWPHVAEDAPHRGIADLFNGTAKHVATHHPDTLEWRDSHALGSTSSPRCANSNAPTAPTSSRKAAAISCTSCWRPISSTNCACWSIRSCSAAASACSTTTRRRPHSGWNNRKPRPKAYWSTATSARARCGRDRSNDRSFCG